MTMKAMQKFVLLAGVLLLGTAYANGDSENTIPRLNAIDHVTIDVPDLDKSTAWYTGTLGFTVASRNEQFVVLGRGAVTLVLNKITTPDFAAQGAMRPGGFRVAFAVDAADFTATVAALRSCGTPVEATSDFDRQNGYFQDPDSNGLELTAHAPDSMAQPGAAVTWLADVLLDHLEATSFGARMRRHLPFDRIPDLSADGARREAEFSRQMLARLNQMPNASLPHEQQLLVGVLRQFSRAGSTADEDYWFRFAVTPYAGGGVPIQGIHDALAAAPLTSATDRDRFLRLLDDYIGLVKMMREKTLGQAQRNIRVPQPALPGVLATLNGLRSSAQVAIEAAAARAPERAGASGSSFKTRVHGRIAEGVLPAYDAVIAVFGKDYPKNAPSGVGVGQYAGGKSFYRRRIFAETGLELEPEAIHRSGLQQVAELDAQLAKIRAEVGFKGDRSAFNTFLRTDPRFLASTPADVEARYIQHIERIVPMLPKYFAVLPQAPYGVKRLDPAAEAGMTYGYYYAPTAAEPRGLYHYNGSNLSQRSLVTSAHLIYHELLPGHHLRLSLAAENESLHPVLTVLSFGAYEEGWAEYAAQLAMEIGAMPDPYDRYGHLISQSFLASRLVVDTGMNDLGWSRRKALQFMQAHSFESDTQIATETLRYSTDMPAQALGYRLGYQAFIDGRRRAERALGARFDIRAFDTAMCNNGAMTHNVLERQVDWFIAQARTDR